MAFVAEVVGSNGTGKTSFSSALAESPGMQRREATGFRPDVDSFRKLGLDLRYLLRPAVLSVVLKLRRVGEGFLGVRLLLVYAETRRELRRGRSASVLLIDESFSKKLCDQVPFDPTNPWTDGLRRVAPELARLIARTYDMWILLECEENVLVERMKRKGLFERAGSEARLLSRYRRQMELYERIADELERRSFPVLRIRSDDLDPGEWLEPIRLAASREGAEHRSALSGSAPSPSR